MIPVVFLFDLDGVMVQPLGYRAAVRATVNHFAGRMGLPDMAPEDHTVAIFEAQGITCEWDMIPITLSILMEAAAQHTGEALEADTFEEACEQIRNRQVKDLSLDYAPFLRQLGQYMKPGEAPAETLLALCQGENGNHLFPHLSRRVLRDLLKHTRRPAHSRTTHLFETYVLGDQVFAEAMRMEPGVKTGSLLEQYDRPLLSPSTRDQLMEAAASGLRMAVYTARPSIPTLPWGGGSEPLAVFAPEAEMALALVGIQALPVIGSGQMGELAVRLGEHEDRMAKPAPYHALAAVAAACLDDRSAALAWVERIFLAIEQDAGLTGDEHSCLPDVLTLHIFEDSPSGIRGVKQAAQILRRLGIEVNVCLWGISEHPEKRAALASVGAELFPDINQAIKAALER